MITFENLKSNIIYKNKKDIIFDNNSSIIFFSNKYENINNFFVSNLFKVKNIKGYLLNKNIIELFENDDDYVKYFKPMLYKNRFRSSSVIMEMLKSVKKNIPTINKISIDNPVDFTTSFINNTSLHNEYFINEFRDMKKNVTILKKISIFEKYLSLYPLSLKYNNYNNIILIPVFDWVKSEDDLDYKLDINPISYLLYSIRKNKGNIFNNNTDILFYTDNDIIKFNFNILNDKTESAKFRNNILKMVSKNLNININFETDDINNLEINDEPDIIIDNEDIVNIDNISDIVNNLSSSIEEYKEMSDKQIKYIEENDNKIRNIKINNKKIGEIVDNDNDNKVDHISLDIDSINDVWKNLSYITADSVYNLDNDIVKIFYFYGEINKSELILTDLKVEDTSTATDAKFTWTAKYRNMKTANEFDVKIDIPKIIDNKFMYLGGNNKFLGKQLFRIPLSKSNKFEVQMVSNYNKIFISPNKDNFTNRTSREVYKLSKVLSKDLKNIKVIKGDNTISNDRYIMDIERYDLSKSYSEIIYKDYNIKLNMDDLKNNHDKIIGFKGNSEIHFNGNAVDAIIEILKQDNEFSNYYKLLSDSSNYIFSKAKMMGENLPIMYILGYYNGFKNAMKIANIEYEIVDKKERNDNYNYIKLNDFIIKYENNVRNSLLMCGLIHAGIEMFNLEELENHNTWIDMLDNMNISRIKSDGLDNFLNLFLDPITNEVCKHYNLPQNFNKLLVLASDSLLNTDFLEHGNVKSYRLRSNEQIAGYLYYALSEEYAKFSLSMKKTKRGKISIKQNKVINLIMQDKMFSDTSDINDLHSIEMTQQVSVKGLKGMNESRSFSLDKRSYDKSMNGILTASTGFAGNVGMDRQIALNAKIQSSRGYLDDINVTSNDNLSLGDMSVTDSMIALSATSDDPFRQLMGNVQRNKHMLNVRYSSPPLITSGTDSALPFLTRNLFSVKAKKDGKVIEINDSYILIEYNDGTKDFINMYPQSIKDSGGGMHLELRYDTDLKLGSKFKKNDILAYDRTSYSKYNNEISYNFGTLAKVAFLNTEEGYEDSSIVSTRLSEKMSSIIIKIKDITINKKSVIHFAAQVGDYIREGEPLLIYQNPFDESETNELLSKLNSSEVSIVNELGKIIIKSKSTGYIQDIRAYRTVDFDDMSDSVKKYFNLFNKPYKDKLKIIEKNNIEDKKTDYNFMEKQSLSGKLKNAYDSVLFEYHIRTTNKFSNGDKLVLYTANKGVNYKFFPEGLEPTSEYRPDEIIDTFGTLSAINKRKVTSVPKVALINKLLIELTRQCRDMLGIKYDINDI